MGVCHDETLTDTHKKILPVSGERKHELAKMYQQGTETVSLFAYLFTFCNDNTLV